MKKPVATYQGTCECGTMCYDFCPPCLDCRKRQGKKSKKQKDSEKDPVMEYLAPLCDTIINLR